MTKLENFQMKHLLFFESISGHDMWSIMEFNLGRKDQAFLTLKSEARVYAIFGIVEIRRGVVELGVFRSKYYERVMYEFSKATKNLIYQNLAENYVRAEVYIDAEWDGADRWAAFLGLTKDGICYNYDVTKKPHKRYYVLLGED